MKTIKFVTSGKVFLAPDLTFIVVDGSHLDINETGPIFALTAKERP